MIHDALRLALSAVLAIGWSARCSPASVGIDAVDGQQKPPVSKPTAAEPVPKKIEQALKRSIALLIESQESLEDGAKTKGEWPYEGVYRFEGEIPIGYRVGGTSIVATALLDATAPTLANDALKAVERALDFVLVKLDEPLMSAGFAGSYDVRGWGQAYALQFLLRMRELGRVPAARQDAVEKKIDALVDALQKTAIQKRGGWNYSRRKDIDDCPPSTFMSASTLQVLFAAAQAGETVDPDVVEKALASIDDARLDTGAFQYATNPKNKNGKGFEDVAGSTGRSTVCETTLLLAGTGSVERVRQALDQFFEHWEWLEKRRKQNGTHVEPYFIAPYYFFYAHRYAAQGIEFLDEKDRPAYREKLYALFWKVREKDGGWNDRVFPRSESFGTAMAVMAMLEPTAARPAGWVRKSTQDTPPKK